MVDGKWLWEDTEDMSEVREALTQTAQQEDEALLKDESLSPGSRTAIEYRLWLKRAQEAQKESAAQIKEARIAKEAEEKAQRAREVSLSAAINAALDIDKKIGRAHV